jgi:methyl coenzyme M reductase subunit D
MKIDQLSGRERGEENLAKVRRYLAGLRAIGQSLPLQDGHPNITAIAEASGVLRNVFYTNAGVKRLLAEFIGGPDENKKPPTGLARAERQLEIKERRILQLEQQLASVKAETGELRKRLAAAEQKLARYAVIEEEILKAGKRVIP